MHTERVPERVAELFEAPVSFGRGPAGVDRLLPGARVSRRHFRLEPLREGGHLLIDLGSSNGTFVNDRRVASSVLEPFDRVRAGDHEMVYLDPGVSVAKVIELMSPGETSHGRGSAVRSVLAERLLALTLLVQERGCDLDLVTTLDAVLDELVTWSGHSCGLLLLEPSSGSDVPEVLHAQRLDPALLAPERVSELLPALAGTLEAGHAGHHDTPLGRATLCVPLESRRSGGRERRRTHPGEVRGVLFLGGREQPRWLSDEEESLLRSLARQVAILVSNARLVRQVATDGLTELPNRTHLERVLAEALLGTRDTAVPVGVVLLDVDDFKRVNDTHGHAVGDAVLREVAERLRGAVRHSDTAGRWGGEEFLVVLADADLAGARLVAEKIVQAIAATPMAGLTDRVTVSAGVAAAPLHGLDPRDLLERADQALYAAKRLGKNRAHAFDPATIGAAGVPIPEPASLGDTLRGTPRVRNPLLARDAPPPAAWLECELLAPIPLHRGATISLGRDGDCSSILPHRSVSRLHCVIHVSDDGEQITLEDRSRNGSILNGQRVSQITDLVPDDVIRIGPYELRLRREHAPSPLDTSPGVMISTGRLEETGVRELFLQLERTRSTGALIITSGDLTAEVLVRDGYPVRAHAGPALDLEALRRMLWLKRGAHLFSEQPVEEPRRIPFSFSGLLHLICAGGRSA